MEALPDNRAMVSIRRVNFQHLLYLEALVTERHVTRAADRMQIGQPAMSAALAKLRTVFNDPLLVKTSTGMEPTTKAVQIARRLREIEDLLEGRGFEGDEFDAGSSQARFRIMASDGISRVLLPELMAITGRHAPGMAFTVQPGDPRRVAEYLRDSDFDLAVSFVRNPPKDLHQTVLYPQSLVCIARTAHPALHGGLTLSQFVALQHTAWGAPPVAYATMEVAVDEALEALGVARRIALRVSSLNLLPGVVARSELLAVVPEQLARSAQEVLPLQILPLPFEIERVDVSMIWHGRSQQDPAHRWLRATLREIGRRLAGADPAATPIGPLVTG
jgi:DNA-binding transcriptional LysR family regulator